MPKKKAKKKVKKSVRIAKKPRRKAVSERKAIRRVKTRRKRVIAPLTELQMKALLHRKIHQVMSDFPEIECTGKGLDHEGNEYAYTEAELVFRQYGDAMREIGLTCIPIEKTAVLGKTAYMIHAKYKLTDIDTGYSEVITGSGLGTNGSWAANSAQTVALKQALLETFMASWPQPAKYKDLVKKEAREIFGQVERPEDIAEALGTYFGNYNVKGKQDERDNSSRGEGANQKRKSGAGRRRK